jgi:hypothetical protein
MSEEIVSVNSHLRLLVLVFSEHAEIDRFSGRRRCRSEMSLSLCCLVNE